MKYETDYTGCARGAMQFALLSVNEAVSPSVPLTRYCLDNHPYNMGRMLASPYADKVFHHFVSR